MIVNAWIGLLYLAASPQIGGLVDHGVAAPVAESRGLVAAQDERGRNLLVACSMDLSERGWILVSDIDSGKTEQHFYPEGVPNSPPFASLYSRNGRFYTCAGPTLLEFDLNLRQFTFYGVPAPSQACYTGSAFADGPDGRIYAGSYPNCHLVVFDPKTRQMSDYGPMDPREQYMITLAFDSAGWAYCGIGTARYNIVAFHPGAKERRQIVPEEERKLGSASVYTGTDGQVYGQAGDKWYRCFEGKAESVDKEAVAPPAPSGAVSWGGQSASFPDGRRVRNFDMPERSYELVDRNGQARRMTFNYKSEGAEITSLVAGPDGKIYGSSAHPMHFFSWTPGEKTLKDLGPLDRVGGGNFCAMAVRGKAVAGAAYSGGYLYLFDTGRPWNGEKGDSPNPRLLTQYDPDIHRPRALIVHPDGKHLVMGGYMGYGLSGGGLGFYNLETGQSELLTHRALIPDQSTVTLRTLPDGNLVGGTSIETPGGGHSPAQEGVLYILDWKTRKIVYQVTPVPGAGDVFSLETGPGGLVYGLASGSRFFVFDLKKRQVVHREDLSAYGGLPRPALQMGADRRLYALFTGAVVRIDPKTFRHIKLVDAPGSISAGLAILDGRLYFAVGSHLWSVGLGKR
ncbi:MAG: hypothetical protein IT210_12700 [Armatimonadetes bacterium]|nr:hypothetical protein [Armatimonadota bacterium]